MLRFFAALLAAIVSFAVALIAAGVVGMVLPQKAASVAATIVFVAVPIVTFIVVYRFVPRGRRALRAEVEERQQLAIDRRIPEKARTIADGGEGIWQTDTWRVTDGDTPSIQVVENGAWTTVFQARFIPEEKGQWVPWRIYSNGRVSSTREGKRHARWEILVYRSGPWEEQLDAHVRAAEDAALARDRERMGIR
jgi:membrane protein implicated in regulation of membrane protease activity